MRYPLCADFARELKRLSVSPETRSAIVPPPPVGFAKPPQASAQRNRLWLGVTALAVVTIAAVLAVVAAVFAAQRGDDEASVSAARTSAAEVSASSSTTPAMTPRSSSTGRPAVAACTALTDSSVRAITAVNDYVNAFNANDPQAAAKGQAAIDALHASADQVATLLRPVSSQRLRDALQGYVDAIRRLAAAILGNAGSDEFNAAITRLNDAKTTALNRCDAAY